MKFKVIGITIFILLSGITNIFNENIFGVAKGNSPFSRSSEWAIENITILENKIIDLNMDLTIYENGSLTLVNSSIIMNCSYDGEFNITVMPGGLLRIINGSYITTKITNNKVGIHGSLTNNYNIIIEKLGQLIISNSTISYAGYSYYPGKKETGLWINSGGTIIENSLFFRNHFGITYDSCSGYIYNCSFVECGKGVYLDEARCQIIKCSFMNGGSGVFASDSSLSYISHCIFENHQTAIVNYGTKMDISNCTFNNSDKGIYLSYSSGNILRDNKFENNNYTIDFYFGYDPQYNYYQDIDTTNYVNGKPIYFYNKKSNLTINGKLIKPGLIILSRCTNITVQNCNFSKLGEGIILFNCTYCKIKNGEFSDVLAINLISSEYNQLFYNNFSNSGIDFNNYGEGSEKNRIYFNNFILKWWPSELHRNTWNNIDNKGNYWSDYNGTDNNSDLIGDTKIPHHGDYYPFTVKSGWLIDTDNDNIPDTEDNDDDNDGYNDTIEKYGGSNPSDNKSVPKDNDYDFIIDNFDEDDDNDRFLDIWEEFLGTNTMDRDNKPLDFDGDNIPDGDLDNSQSWMDNDDDNDGHLDTDDDYPFDDERWKKEYSKESNEFYWIYILFIIIIITILSIIYFIKKKK
jgi:parallel beta-helix repeat protein